MPIYAYRCDDCGHAQDFLQKMSDPLIDTCPQCGSKNFKKQLTAAGFQLKGGGWYVTDFRDNGKKDGKKSDAPATGVPAPATTASEGKGDLGGGAKTESSTPAASSGSGGGSSGGTNSGSGSGSGGGSSGGSGGGSGGSSTPASGTKAA